MKKIKKKRPLIIVLEDSPERIDWLKSAIIGVDILVFEVVKDFVKSVNENKDDDRLKMVIFDHDLGCRLPDNPSYDYCMTTDPEGLTGHDAAKMLENISCSTLVWSLNSVGSRNIQRELVSKCGKQIFDEPFLSCNKKRMSEVILTECFPKEK